MEAFRWFSKKLTVNDGLGYESAYQDHSLRRHSYESDYKGSRTRSSHKAVANSSPQNSSRRIKRDKKGTSKRENVEKGNFWDSISDQTPPTFSSSDIIIAVMGMTGAGKTSFISTMTNTEMEIGHGLSSCTKSVGIASMKLHGRTIHFIDTPGFDDTNLKDVDILRVIALYLDDRYSQNIRVSGIIYLHRITDPRVSGSALENIKLFRNLVGSNNMQNAILVTTMWKYVDKNQGEARTQDLITTDKFWANLISDGATYTAYDGTRKDATRIVESLLEYAPCMLQIQQEMAEGKALEETSAGQQVKDKLAEAEVRHQEEMRRLREEMDKARDLKEIEKLEELRSGYEEVIRRLEEEKLAQRKLSDAQLEVVEQRIRELEAKINNGRCIVQ